MGSRRKSSNSNSSGKSQLCGPYVFIKALLMNAYTDTPREIVEWCKTQLCRNLCYWAGIDINDYRRKMLSMALKKEIPQPAKPFAAVEEPAAVLPVKPIPTAPVRKIRKKREKDNRYMFDVYDFSSASKSNNKEKKAL